MKMKSAGLYLVFRGWAALLLPVMASCSAVMAAEPGWWSERSVIDAGADSNDYAVAVIGQLKHIAARARDELEEHLPRGAGTRINGLVDGWYASPGVPAGTDFNAVANVGQAKAVAKLFYQRLAAERFSAGEPWTQSRADDDNHSPLNTGQIKALFSFDIREDADADQLPDMWETAMFGDIAAYDGTEDLDGDGVSIAAEYANWLHPLLGDSDLDGFDDSFSVDLAGWWRLDAPGGDLAIDSGVKARHGTVVDAARSSDGVLSGALGFSGANDRIELPGAVLDGATDVSLAFWMKSGTDSLGKEQAIVSGGGPGNFNEFLVSLNPDNSLDVYDGNQEGTKQQWSATELTGSAAGLLDGKWHHVVVIRDQTGGDITVHVDGQSRGTKSVPAGMAALAVDGIFVGQEQDAPGGAASLDPEQRYHGLLDDIRIYRAVLSPAQIASLHAAQWDSDGDGLPDWWERSMLLSLDHDAAGDPDADGADNGTEFTNGTHPAFAGLADLEAPYVSEFMAGNRLTSYDEDGDASPWIEIRNPTGSDFDIGGWHLSDDAQNLAKWAFPAGTVIEAGGRLVVYASGKDRTPTPAGELHTSFSLAETGGYLALSDAGSNIRNDFAYGSQEIDHSYGIARDGREGFLFGPSPGSSNSGYVDGTYAPAPQILLAAGFYANAEPVTVQINGQDADTVPGVSVHYTLDGSDPASGAAQLYTGPVTVGSEGSTVLRACAIEAEKWPSATETRSYIYLDSVLTQTRPAGYPTQTEHPEYQLEYAMDSGAVGNYTNDTLKDQLTATGIPTMSIAMPVEELFGRERGIYANSTKEGIDWERAASVEWIDPPADWRTVTDHGSPVFQIGSGIRIDGEESRRFDLTRKHEFRLLFSEGYDRSSPFLQHPLFPDSALQSFSGIVLKTPTYDSWAVDNLDGWDMAPFRDEATYVADAWASSTLRALGHALPHRRWVHLYLNGLYWGIYEAVERPDAACQAAYDPNASAQDFDVISNNEVVEGDRTDWDDLHSNAVDVQTNPTSSTEYDEVKAQLDIDLHCDFMIVNAFMANTDGVFRDYWAGRPAGGKWKSYNWNAQTGFRTATGHTANIISTLNADGYGPGALYHSLKHNADYRTDFTARMSTLIAGELSASSADARFAAEVAKVDAIIKAESARWGASAYNSPGSGGYYSYQDWNFDTDANSNVRQTFIPSRGAVVQTNIAADLLDTSAPDSTEFATVKLTAHRMGTLAAPGAVIPTPASAATPYVAPLVLNDDDDDAQSGPDNADNVALAGDDDLLMLTLEATWPGGSAPSSGVLKLFSESSGIRFFDDAGTELSGTDLELDLASPAGHPLEALQAGNPVSVFVEGAAAPFAGRITIAAPGAEEDAENGAGGGGGDQGSTYTVQIDDPDDGAADRLTAFNFASGPKGRKIAINGRLIPDEKPQAEDETDQEPEETYIDSLTLHLTHESTDIHIPLVGEELTLNVRRNMTQEIFTDTGTEADNRQPGEMPNRPFGPGWTSGIGAHIRVTEHPGSDKPVFAWVTDENGSVHRFLKIWRKDDPNDQTAAWVPLPSNRTEQESFMMRLVQSQPGTPYVFTRKFGTELVFEDTLDELFKESGQGSNVSFERYARLTRIEDRFGNRIVCRYDDVNDPNGPNTIIPDRIFALTDSSLLDGYDNTGGDAHAGPGFRRISIVKRLNPETYGDVMKADRIAAIIDPRGNAYQYHYEAATLEDGQFDSFAFLSHVTRPDLSVVRYGYDSRYREPDVLSASGQGPVSWYHYFYLNSITDGEGIETRFLFRKDERIETLKQVGAGEGGYVPTPGQTRMVGQVILPPVAGSVTDTTLTHRRAYFRPDPDAERVHLAIEGGSRVLKGHISNVVTDADGAGRVRKYTFGAPQLLDTKELEDLLIPQHEVGDRNSDLLVQWTRMEVFFDLHSSNADETFDYLPEAGMPIEAATDDSGNVTSYLYDDTWVISNFAPELDWVDETNPLFNGNFYDTTSQTNALNGSKEFRYFSDDIGNGFPASRIMKSITDEEGRVTEYQINNADEGLRTAETIKESDGTVVQSRTFEYNKSVSGIAGFMTGETVVSTDPGVPSLVTDYQIDENRHGYVGRTVRYGLDAFGGGTVEIETTRHYDANGNMIRETDARENVTTFRYDKRNRLVEVVYPPTGAYDGSSETKGGAETRTIAYNDRSNKISETDENGIVTLYLYDNLGRVTHVVRDMDGTEGGENALTGGIVGKEGVYDPAAAGPDLVTGTAYSPTGLTLGTRDANGNWAATRYDTRYRPTSTHLPKAEGMSLADVASLNNPNVFRTFLYYDYLPGVIPQNFPLPPGAEANSGGSAFGSSGYKPLHVIDARGFHTVSVNDALYRTTHVFTQFDPSDAEALASYAKSETVYDGVGNALLTEDSLGNQTVSKFDALDRAVATAAGATGETGATVGGFDFNGADYASFTAYTSTGLQWTQTDAEGNITSNDYDGAGRLMRTVHPLVDHIDEQGAEVTGTTETRFTYDGNGNRETMTDPRGSVWTYGYDQRNRKTAETMPQVFDAESGQNDVPEILTEYDKAGNVRTVTDPRTNTTETKYDPNYRVVTVTSPTVSVLPDWNAEDNPVNDAPETASHYDRNGNVVAVTDANGNVTLNKYDVLNRLVATKTRPDRSLPNTLDPADYDDADDRLAEPLDIVVSYEYEEDTKNRTRVTDGEGHVTEFQYDGMNRVTKTIHDPLPGAADTYVFEYDGVNKTGREDAMGRDTTYTYDTLNRLKRTEYAGASEEDREYDYDKVGNIVSVIVGNLNDPQRSPDIRDVAYTYDNHYRVASETSAGVTHRYEYDANGNRRIVRYNHVGPANHDIELASTYDALNRLHDCVETYRSGSGARTTSYRYDLGGNTVTKTLPNGLTTTTTHDALNRVDTATTGTGAPVQKFSYRYDRAGNVRWIKEEYPFTGGIEVPSREVASRYDRAYRLVEEFNDTTNPAAADEMTAFEYDRADNRTGEWLYWIDPSSGWGSPSITTYTHNSRNQIQSINGGTWTYAYDANGNRRLQTGVGESTTYTYDREDRLKSVTQGSSPPEYTGSFQYDYRTRRVEVSEATDFDPVTYVPATVSERNLSFSGGKYVQQYTFAGALEREFVRGSDYGGGVGGLLYGIDSATTTASYSHENGRGDVTTKTDANGAITWQGSYEAFGDIGTEAGDASPDRERANTKDHDWSGLINDGFRYRDPTTGTFLTRDPAGFVDGPNLYSYVRQNPWTAFDPEGLELEILTMDWWVEGTKANLKRLKGAANVVKDMGEQAIKGTPGMILVRTATGDYQREAAETLKAAGTVISDPAAAVKNAKDNIVEASKTEEGQGALLATFFGSVWGGKKSLFKLFKKNDGVDTPDADAPSNGASSAVNKVNLEKQLASQEQLGQLSSGGGTVISQPAKQADRIARQTGRDPANIQKVSSDARTATDGQHIETHSFRDASDNSLIEPKTIIDPAGG